EMFVPIDRIAQLGPDVAKTSTTKLNLAQFERREGEVLLRSDVLDRSLINVNTARLVTAREVEIVCEAGVWRVARDHPRPPPPPRRLRPVPARGSPAPRPPRPASSCLGKRGSRSSPTSPRRG